MLAASYQQTEESARHSRGSAQSRVGLLDLDTSDPNLAAAFGWARRQALAYSFSGDLVGDWYEAALPGRQAFCMRDVSHQLHGRPCAWVSAAHAEHAGEICGEHL